MGESLLAGAIRTAGSPEALIAQVGLLEVHRLLKTWEAIARPEQLEPAGEWWDVWLVLAGRGFGKTRTGAEWARARVMSGECGRLSFVGPTRGDVRDAMVEGESGVMELHYHDRRDRPKYEPSKARITWPNGAITLLYSAEEPDRLRNKQHDSVWADEVAAWQYPQDTWDMMQMGNRLGRRPRVCATTTPRPIPLVRALKADPTTVITGGSTYENQANLARQFLARVLRKYEGTRLGRQEIKAEVLGDTPGALWILSMIDALRVANAPELRRIVIGIDPAVKELGNLTAEERQQLEESGGLGETGMVAAGRAPCNCKGTGEEDHAFVLSDLSGWLTPAEWAARAATAYKDLEADRVVAEINNGGALVRSNLMTLGHSGMSYKSVTAARGKQPRAEPVAALYEQGKVHHVGAHGKLEDELTTWQPLLSKRSPNRLDALVWTLTDLMLDEQAPGYRRPRPEVRAKLQRRV